MSELNKKAPLDVLVKDGDKDVSLRDMLGKYVVLYFYPKDDTPGCTKESCSFRDYNGDIKKLGAEVIGVSKDDHKSHEKFRDKYSLDFTLWSDMDGKLADALGVWGEKSFMGRKFMGMHRKTFIIDPEGKIVYEWQEVKPEGHAEEVLNILKNLMN